LFFNPFNSLAKAVITERPEYLNLKLIDYVNTVSIFKSFLEEKADLSDLEIGSLCQTWFKKGVTGKPSFSVPSPHFQTFFYKKTPYQ
jgi:hypothetical protein